jgi:hypothetical protein
VEVAALGDALPGLGVVGEGVALDNGHLVEVIGEDAGREEAGHAAAEDNGALAAKAFALRNWGSHKGGEHTRAVKLARVDRAPMSRGAALLDGPS